MSSPIVYNCYYLCNFWNIFHVIFWKKYIKLLFTFSNVNNTYNAGAYAGIRTGKLKFFPLGVNTQHPFDPKNPLQTVDFSDPRTGWAPKAPLPLYLALNGLKEKNTNFTYKELSTLDESQVRKF